MGGTLECIYEGTVVRRMGEPEIAADVRQLRKCQLGDGLRNDRPDRAELHTGGHGSDCCIGKSPEKAEVEREERGERRTDRTVPLVCLSPNHANAPLCQPLSSRSLTNLKAIGLCIEFGL